MSFIFLESWFSAQFATINESCGSPYPTLSLISCRILLILQILDNGFHEVVSGSLQFTANSDILQVQSNSRKQKTLDDSNLLKHWLQSYPMHMGDNKYTVECASAYCHEKLFDTLLCATNFNLGVQIFCLACYWSKRIA